MKSAETHPTPQRVIDACHVIAAWLREIDAKEALISPEGGASFHDRRLASEYLDGWQEALSQRDRADAWAAQWKAAAKWWRHEADRRGAVVAAAREAASHDCEEPNYVLTNALAEYDQE